MFANQFTFRGASLYILRRLSGSELATSEIKWKLRVMVVLVLQPISLCGHTRHQNFQWSRFVAQFYIYWLLVSLVIGLQWFPMDTMPTFLVLNGSLVHFGCNAVFTRPNNFTCLL